LHLQLIELEIDVKRLKTFARRADKIAHKRDVLLPKWLPIVSEYLLTLESTLENGHKNENNKTTDNPLFAYCTIWLFDVANLSQAIEYAFLAIKHGQPIASNIKRKWPGFIADTVFDWAETQAEHGRSIEPYFGQVFQRVVNEWALPEQVTAKFYKFAGLALLRTKTGDVTPSHVGNLKRLREADKLLETAASLHKHAQVKTVRNKIAMRIRAITELNEQ
jgi:hypothetical protein